MLDRLDIKNLDTTEYFKAYIFKIKLLYILENNSDLSYNDYVTQYHWKESKYNRNIILINDNATDKQNNYFTIERYCILKTILCNNIPRSYEYLKDINNEI